jgi:hypothetical protein
LFLPGPLHRSARFDNRTFPSYGLGVAEVAVAARLFLTVGALLLAVGAFQGAGPAPAGINLFDVLFLFAAYIVWFEWGAIREGYSYLGESGGRGRFDLMFVRLGPVIIKKFGRKNADGQ